MSSVKNVLLLVVSSCTQRERDQFNFSQSRKLFGPKKFCDIFLFPTFLMIKPISSNPVLNHSIGLISPRRFEVLQQMVIWGRELEEYFPQSLAAVTQRSANVSFCLLLVLYLFLLAMLEIVSVGGGVVYGDTKWSVMVRAREWNYL